MVQDGKSAGRHHRGVGQRGVPDRLGAAGPGVAADRQRWSGGSRRPAAATRTMFRDRTRSVRRAGACDRGAEAARAAPSDRRRPTVLRITGELADLAERAPAEAEAVLGNARRALRRVGTAAGRGRGAAINELDTRWPRWSARIVAQTRRRLAGEKPDRRTRVVSLHDPDARPIVKGRLGKPVEFGYKAQVVDNEDGIVLDYTVEDGNPPDAATARPGHQRIKHRARPSTPSGHRRPRLRRGRASRPTSRPRRQDRRHPPQGPTRRRPPSHRAHAERSATSSSGAPARGPHQPPQTPLRLGPHPDGSTAHRTWCGLGVLAHNPVKIAALIDEPNVTPPRAPTSPSTAHSGPRGQLPPTARPTTAPHVGRQQTAPAPAQDLLHRYTAALLLQVEVASSGDRTPRASRSGRR